MIELTVQETGSIFTIEKYKADFSKPVLFNFLVKNSISNNTIIAYNINCLDKDNNIIKSNDYLFDFSNNATIVIPKL
ncbi:MAG: hypothetical protein QM710_10510 [Flavobacterium sp.]